MNQNVLPLVSICCTTYNHEKYIQDCLEGFLEQETEFHFEVIVHDDASTDNTQEIIEEFRKIHPNVIKPIYQTENQYSKGIEIASTFIAPKVRGKYVATCEGDDYWTDPYKLQKQVEFLEGNLEYSMCFHRVAVVDTNRNFTGGHWGSKGNSRPITIKNAAVAGTVHLSSIVLRSEYYKQRPDWLKHARHGDYAFALYLAAEGKVFYLDEVMSSYRTGVENSMMTKFRSYYTKEKEIDYLKNRIETLNLADEYYDCRFHKEIQSVNIISEVKIGLLRNDFSKVARQTYWKFISLHGITEFLKMFLSNKYTYVSKILVSLRKFIRKRKFK